MKCFNTMFSELETEAKARLAGAGEDWHTLGYLTRRGVKCGSGLTLCNLCLRAEHMFLAVSKARDKVSIQHSSCAPGGF